MHEREQRRVAADKERPNAGPDGAPHEPEQAGSMCASVGSGKRGNALC